MGPVLDSGGDPSTGVRVQRESAHSQALYGDLQFHDEGGLGEVYAARDLGLNRPVALKFIQPHRVLDPAIRRRFLLEAEVTSRLEHPGIVPIYGVGHDGAGQPCYAMRLVRGETLQHAIDRFHDAPGQGRDRAERAARLRALLLRFVAVCNTVAYAHSQGVLHCDLKPRNILLDSFEVTLVVDWGLARLLDLQESGIDPVLGSPGAGSVPGADTTAEAPVGTPQFMSPEQTQGRPLGTASDIYSLGATLCVLLRGRMPLQRRPTVGRPANSAIPPALEAVCQKAMALRPEDRYTTALDLASDVQRWLAGEPVSAWREPPRARMARWTRVHKPVLLGTVVAVMAAALAAGAMGAVSGRKIAILEHELQKKARVERMPTAASEGGGRHVRERS